jgi:carboxyl-terminal processing protease
MFAPGNRRRALNILWIAGLCAGFFGFGWYFNARLGNVDEQLLVSAHQKIRSESLFNQQSGEELANAAVRGMLAEIDDPFAELIEPEAAQDLVETFAGKTGVVGLYAENRNGQVVIAIVFPESAAEKAGLQTGDVILSIDGVKLDEDTDSSETGLLIRGAPGTAVQLEILRQGQTRLVEVIRQERQFVVSHMLPGNVAYLSLNAFNKTASARLKQALEELLAQKPVGLIWDLRENEGGDMQAAQEMLSYFIDDGLLFSAELTGGRRVPFHAKGSAFAAGLPLVVLIDHSTYSAGETAAAAIAESGRGVTVGSATYGKGLIQATMPLKGGALLQMTIAKWLSAKGEWYQERGVPPQVEALDDPQTEADEVLQQGIEILLDGSNN